MSRTKFAKRLVQMTDMARLDQLLTEEEMDTLQRKSFAQEFIDIRDKYVCFLTVRDLNDIGLACFYEPGVFLAEKTLRIFGERATEKKIPVFRQEVVTPSKGWKLKADGFER